MRVPRNRLIGFALAGCVFAYLGYGIVEPQTSAGHAVFHLGYSFAPTRPAFLRFYRWALAEFSGSYIPGPVDSFLAERLWHCRGTREWTAILDFQLAQSSYRWGDAMSHLPDDLKREIISDLIRRSDTSQLKEAMQMFLLVDALRRDESFSKAQFMKPYVAGDAIYPTVRERFKSWWGDGSSWPANKEINPLHDTGIIVHAP